MSQTQAEAPVKKLVNISNVQFFECRTNRSIGGADVNLGPVVLEADYPALRALYLELQRFLGETGDKPGRRDLPETAEERRAQLEKRAADVLLTDRAELAKIETEAVAMGAVVDWDEYGNQRILWPAKTPRISGKTVP